MEISNVVHMNTFNDNSNRAVRVCDIPSLREEVLGGKIFVTQKDAETLLNTIETRI